MMVEVTGFEPAAFASRTQRSTKLSHTSTLAITELIIPIYSEKSKRLFSINQIISEESYNSPGRPHRKGNREFFAHIDFFPKRE